jgi:hypothetical protein
MSQEDFRKTAVLIHAFIGWALCGAIVFIGMEITSELSALIAHAIGAPIIFAAISWIYFRKFGYTTPIETAYIFLTFVVVVDFFVVALLINRSLDMFTSWLGTWLPWLLLFTSTYITGKLINRNSMLRGATRHA